MGCTNFGFFKSPLPYTDLDKDHTLDTSTDAKTNTTHIKSIKNKNFKPAPKPNCIFFVQ